MRTTLTFHFKDDPDDEESMRNIINAQQLANIEHQVDNYFRRCCKYGDIKVQIRRANELMNEWNVEKDSDEILNTFAAALYEVVREDVLEIVRDMTYG